MIIAEARRKKTVVNNNELNRLLQALVALPKETEWVEFKANFHSEEEIGERLSALSTDKAHANESRA